MSLSDLFRKEALEHQRERLYGEVVILQPFSITIITCVILIIVLFAGIYLVWGEYTRKEIVPGYVVPDKGLIKLYAPRLGTVKDIYIKEDQYVQLGDALFSVVSKRHMEKGQDIDTQLLTELETQLQELENKKKRQPELFNNEKIKLQTAVASGLKQVKQLEQQEVIQKEIVKLNQERFSEFENLFESGHISKRDLDNQNEQLLDQKSDYQILKTQIVRLMNDNKQLQLELKELPVKQKDIAIQIDSQISEVVQRITEVTGRRQFTVYATANGHITALQIRKGETALPDRPLVTILPEGASMEAHLLVPTRAIGFIEKNQKTRLRYAAFPYQRYGIYSGSIKEINKSILMPGEIDSLLTLNEPVYKVTVKLDSQHINAYGKQFPLQAGMQLEADIVIESRSLWDWLLDPIYSIKGKI